MDRFLGSWEFQPEKVEGAEAFWDETNLPEEKRQQRRTAAPTMVFSRDGDKMLIQGKFKGMDNFILEFTVTFGTEIQYTFPEGCLNTGIFEIKGDKMEEKHKSEEGDLVREYETLCYREGDELIRLYSKNGKTMKNVYKKLDVLQADHSDGEIEVKFLRKNGAFFKFPRKDDIAWVNIEDVTLICHPTVCEDGKLVFVNKE